MDVDLEWCSKLSPHRDKLSKSLESGGTSKGQAFSGNWTAPDLSDLVECRCVNKAKRKNCFSPLMLLLKFRAIGKRHVKAH